MNLEGGTVFGAGLAMVIDAGSGDIGVAEPFLDFGDVGFMIEGIGGGGSAEGMGGDGKTELAGVVFDDAPDGIGGNGGFFGGGEGAEQGAVGVVGVTGLVEIIVDEGAGGGMQRDVAGFLAFTGDDQVANAAPFMFEMDDFEGT